MCVDRFTKWVKVVLLKCHDAASVAAALLSVCVRWVPPQVVRSDNGTEFRNAVTHALFEAFEVKVQHGAVRHPQSQGAVERFNRTLLTIIRKTLDGGDDWETALDFLLFHYRVRPHGVTKISPMQATEGVGAVEHLDSARTWQVFSECLGRWAEAQSCRDSRLSGGGVVADGLGGVGS